MRDENWQPLQNQSFKRARLCMRFCMTLTKPKFSQACKRSDLSWNRPSQGVCSCKFCGVGNTVEVASNVVVVSVRDENWQSLQSIFLKKSKITM